MSTKIFLLAVGFLSLLIVVTSPPVVRPFFQHEPTSTPTTVFPSPSLTPTPTVDPFASVPTATPQSQGFVAIQLPAATLGDTPPTFTPTPEGVTAEKQVILLPDPNSEPAARAISTVNGVAPERLKIPKLKLNAKIQPVGVASISGVENAVAGGMPADEADVGWGGDSAALGQAGNTVLTGRHQATAAFYKLWSLEAGDKITLSAGVKSRQYIV
ncbi:MAG: class F sortase, partial [Chloroflexi bacterium]|nr:class F sortase [Chloroflexota bacterium]